jgi:hypothetical protein
MAVLGHKAALTCVVHGVGLDSITWLTEAGDQVKEDQVPLGGGLETSSVLNLADVTENEKYSCRASFGNPADQITSDLTLVYVNRK